MKPNHRNPLLAASILLTLTAPVAFAQNRYWDNNGATTAFGSNSTGTWAAPTIASATQNWSSASNGTSALANYTTLLTDTTHFGTDTSANGVGGGTITVSGIVDTLHMRFGNQSTSNITFTGGTINFAAAGSVSVGAGGTTLMTINSNITGAATSFTKNGNSLTLGGTNTYAGRTIITAGRLQFAKQVSLYNNTDTSWTAANLDVDSGATLAFNVGGTGEFTTGNVSTLLTNLGASSSATSGMNAGSILGFDTTNASGSTFTIADAINNTTGGTGGARGLTKLGTGTLVLTSGSSNYSGATTISGGTLRVESATALGSTPSVAITSGTVLHLASAAISGAPTLTLSGGTIVSDRSGAGVGLTHVFGNVTGVTNATQNFTGGANVNDGNAAIQIGSVTNASGSGGSATFNPTTANLTIAGGYTGATNAGSNNLILSGSAAQNSLTGNITLGSRVNINVSKTGNSVWTLSGNNSVSLGAGSTFAVSGGALIATTLAALPNSGAVTFSGGTLGARIGAGGWTTGQVDSLLSTATKTSGALGIDTTTASLTQWTDFTTGASSLGALGLTKLGTNTLTLNSAANNYTGATTISEGTLKLDVDHTLTGALNFGFGNGTTSPTGTLDLATTNVNATFGALNVLTNSATANTITIGSGKTLLVTGAVALGYGTGPNNASSKLNATGLGTLSIGTVGTPTNANVTLGLGTGTASNTGTLDMSGLSTFYANLGTGTFRIGSATTNANVATAGSTVILAGDSTIVATALQVAGGDLLQNQTLRLGNGTNILNVGTINVAGTGETNSNSGSGGVLNFNSANGNLTVRGLAGGSTRADLTVGWTGHNATRSLTGLFDTTDHLADLRIGNMTIGARTLSAGTMTATGTFLFNQGTLDVDNLTAGLINNVGSATGNISLSGGNVTINNTADAIRLGVNTLSSRVGTGNLNISGTANVTVGAFSGTSIRLGDAQFAGTNAVTGAVNITGGTLTVAGDIVRGATTGTSVATLAINGASAILDMGGKNITGLTSITYTDGTLKNLGTVNTGMTLAGSGSRVIDQGTGVNGTIQGNITGSGIGLTKQGDGKLTLSGANNTYDGATLVSAGTLFVTGSLSASAVTVGANGTVGSNGVAGTLNNGLTIQAGGNLDLTGATIATNSTGILGITGGSLTLGNLTFLDIVGWDWLNASNGTYELIDGGFTVNFGSTTFLDVASAYDFGNGKKGYFTSGSLNAVVIPEPSTALLGAIGLIALLRRRR